MMADATEASSRPAAAAVLVSATGVDGFRRRHGEVSIGEFLGWYAKRNGRAAVEDAIYQAKHPDRETLVPSNGSFGILASRWYPAELVHELLDRLTAGRRELELDEMARDAATFIMGRTLHGVYRTMFSLLATPERYVRYSDKLWNTHYDTGTLLFRVPEPGTHYVTYQGWRSHHPFICRMNMASSVPIYSAMGCKNVRHERQSCIADGKPVCRNLVRWGEPSVPPSAPARP
jgi:hypothetical protein